MTWGMWGETTIFGDGKIRGREGGRETKRETERQREKVIT